jgi:hypothetical protein
MVSGLAGALAVQAATATQSPSAVAPATCQGVPATLVGSPQTTQLTGTGAADVVVTGGARGVTTLGGADRVCVTGQTAQVSTGDGDDRVLTGDLAVATSTSLGSGGDQFDGGARDDSVSPGLGVDRVDTGDGADHYSGPETGAANGDRVNLGPGADSAQLDGSNLEDDVDGGAGFNSLSMTMDDGVDHAWVVNNGTGTATMDGTPRFHWSNFQGFTFGSFDLSGTLVFRGTDAAERVRAFQEFEFGPRIEALDMRGGDDRVALSGLLGPIMAGGGNDWVRLYGFRDERSLGMERMILLDLGAGTLRTSPAGPASDLSGVENVDVTDFMTIDVRGDPQANKVIAGDSCLVRFDGLGGPDVLHVKSGWGCSKRTADFAEVPRSVRADAGPGSDVLQGRHTRDRLIGGLGTDAADGRQNIDLCEAEIRQACES